MFAARRSRRSPSRPADRESSRRSRGGLFSRSHKRNRRLRGAKRAEAQRGLIDLGAGRARESIDDEAVAEATACKEEIQRLRSERERMRKEARQAAQQKRNARKKARRARQLAAAKNVLGQVGRGVVTSTKLLLLAMAMCGAAAAGYYGYRRAMASTHFDVAKIEVVGARHALPSDVARQVEQAKGRSIFSVDKARIEAAIQKHPWVARARVLRVLPSTLRVEITEHKAIATTLLGHLYLISENGELFKRATAAEADGLPVLSGPDREQFKAKPELARWRIQRALDALERYRAQIRPPLSEVHVGALGEVTLFLRKGGTALRFGTQLSDERLQQLDAVWAALGGSSRRARAIYLDHEARVNRVVVRLVPQPGTALHDKTIVGVTNRKPEAPAKPGGGSNSSN
jgi:cell division protein FtsQ